MSIKTLTLAFAAGLLASQAYAKLQQTGGLADASTGSDDGEDVFGSDDMEGDLNARSIADEVGLSSNGGMGLPPERLGSGVLGESPDEATEPFRANDAQLFGSNSSESERPVMPGIPDLMRGA